MSKTDLRVVLGVDGELEFQRKMNSLKRQQAEINSEMRKNSSALSDNASAYDKAKIKAEGLTKKIAVQEEKVKLLKEAYEKSKKELGENADETLRLKAQYQNAEAQLNKFKKELNETTQALDKNIAKSEAAAQKLEKFGNATEKVGKKAKKVGNTMTKYLTTGILTAGAAAAKAAVEYEDAFAGVKKTVDASDDEFKKLNSDILKMSTQLPVSANEIAGVAEAAGQLGIKINDINSFTEVMLKLGMSTNLSAEEAASALAKFANITKMKSSDYDKLGAVIVDLGNNFATTEADIVKMTTRLASTGAVVGYSESQMLAISTALSSVGIEAEAGGSAFGKLSKKLALAAAKGEEELSDWARVAGVSAKEFKKAYEKDALEALNMFINGLNDKNRLGKNSIEILSEMGIKEVRESNAVLALANSNDILGRAVKTANNAWSENSALNDEVSRRLETTGSKLTLAKNELTKTAIIMGDNFLPAISNIAKSVGELAEKFGKLTKYQQKSAIKLALIVAAAGPTISVFGKLTQGVGSTAKAISTLAKVSTQIKLGTYAGPLSGIVAKLGATTNATTGVTAASKGLLGVIGAGAPLIIGLTVAATAAVALGVACHKATEGTRHLNKSIEDLSSHFGNFDNDVANAKNLLEGLNKEIIVSSEEQQKVTNAVDSVQADITKIAKTAANKRRKLTKDEIDRLDELFGKLQELSNEELSFLEDYQNAALQMAKSTTDFSKENSEDLIRTAEDTKNDVIEKAKEQYGETLALAQRAYEQEGSINKQEYDEKCEAAKKSYDLAVKNAEKTFADTYSIITEGYYQQNIAHNENLQELIKLNQDKIDEDSRYNNERREILSDYNKTEAEKQLDLLAAKARHQAEVSKIQGKMADEVDKLNQDELAAWIEMSANCEAYGGKISSGAKATADNFIGSFNNMPKKAKEKFKETMQGMLNGISERQGELYRKAENIANGFINKIKTTLDIHSPSRVMRKLFNYAVEGAEVGVDEETPKLISKAEKLADDFVSSFEGKDFSISPELKSSARSFFEKDFGARLRGLTERTEAFKERVKNISENNTATTNNFDNSKKIEYGEFVAVKIEKVIVNDERDIRKLSQQIEAVTLEILRGKGVTI